MNWLCSHGSDTRIPTKPDIFIYFLELNLIFLLSVSVTMKRRRSREAKAELAVGRGEKKEIQNYDEIALLSFLRFFKFHSRLLICEGEKL